jgi:glycosyltransferase involved in cell wall biosynthesis
LHDDELSVLMVIEGEIATTQLLEQVLQAGRRFGIIYRKALLSSLTIADLNPRTVPLFVRCGDRSLRFWIKLLNHARHPYLYYLDDNFWEIQGNSPVALYYRDSEVRDTLRLAVSQAHQVLTNSEVLASYLERFTCRVRVLPPFFDFGLIEGCARPATAEIRIGFAGSSTRQQDLELVRPVIQPALDRIPGAVFEFCGALPVGVEPGPGVRFFPYVDSYVDFIRFQAGRNWAIGLAPLRDTVANRAKTNNKYREYGGCGIAGLYSNIDLYRGCVEHGVTGFLVDDRPESWLSAIEQLAFDAAERRRMGERAAQDVRATHCVSSVTGAWVECIGKTQLELSQRPSHLARAYWTGAVMEHTARKLRILGLQVEDAYRKGGAAMVVSRSARRAAEGLARMIRTR